MKVKITDNYKNKEEVISNNSRIFKEYKVLKEIVAFSDKHILCYHQERSLKKKRGSRSQIANIVRHILYKGSVGNNLATIKIINVTV